MALDAGTLPTTSIGPAALWIDGGYSWRWTLGAHWFPGLPTVGEEGVDLRIGAVGGELGVAYLVHAGPLAFGPQVVGGIDFIYGRAVGTATPTARTTYVGRIGGQIIVLGNLSSVVDVVVRGGVAVPFNQPSFTVGGQGTVHQVGALAGRGSLAAVFRF